MGKSSLMIVESPALLLAFEIHPQFSLAKPACFLGDFSAVFRCPASARWPMRRGASSAPPATRTRARGRARTTCGAVTVGAWESAGKCGENGQYHWMQ